MKKDNVKKKKTLQIDFTTKKIMEQAYYDDDLNCFVMNDGSFMDLIQGKHKRYCKLG